VGELGKGARLRFQVGLALLAVAGVLELLMLVRGAPAKCVGQDGELGEFLGRIGVPTIIGCWLVALVFLIWGRERTVYGLHRIAALLLVAFVFPPAVVSLVGRCLS
jgi:hypothetical protein